MNIEINNAPNIMLEICVERVRQDDKWGGPEHDDEHSVNDWADFIRMRLSNQGNNTFRQRMIEVAALAIAAIESTDRLS